MVGVESESVSIISFISIFPCCFVAASATQLQPPAMIGGLPVGPGVSPQPGFLFRGAWFPLVVTFPIGQSKAT